MTQWYSRPVLFVGDADRAVEFYVAKLGFTEAWRHVDGKTLVAQVDRQGCELILSSQWPDKAGSALNFVSLDRSGFDALRPELEAKGVAVKDGYWGYPILVVADPDGNELYFPDPGLSDPGLSDPGASDQSAANGAQP